jgi:hypothetical protein
MSDSNGISLSWDFQFTNSAVCWQTVCHWVTPFRASHRGCKRTHIRKLRWIQNKIDEECRWPGTLEHAQSFFHLRGAKKSTVGDACRGRLIRSFGISSFRGTIQLQLTGGLGNPNRRRWQEVLTATKEMNDPVIIYCCTIRTCQQTAVRSAHTAHLPSSVIVSPCVLASCCNPVLRLVS